MKSHEWRNKGKDDIKFLIRINTNEKTVNHSQVRRIDCGYQRRGMEGEGNEQRGSKMQTSNCKRNVIWGSTIQHDDQVKNAVLYLWKWSRKKSLKIVLCTRKKSVTMWSDEWSLKLLWWLFCNIYINQITMFYTLNEYKAVCQFARELERIKNKILKEKYLST